MKALGNTSSAKCCQDRGGELSGLLVPVGLVIGSVMATLPSRCQVGTAAQPSGTSHRRRRLSRRFGGGACPLSLAGATRYATPHPKGRGYRVFKRVGGPFARLMNPRTARNGRFSGPLTSTVRLSVALDCIKRCRSALPAIPPT
jgi:hypothetical protein